jgi:hypothetical protein
MEPDNKKSSTVASEVDFLKDINDLTELLQARCSRPMIHVPDAPSEEEFLRFARQMYLLTRPGDSTDDETLGITRIKRGRRSDENRAMAALTYLEKATWTKKVEKLRQMGLSKNTVDKYLRLDRISREVSATGTEGLSQADNAWLVDEFGKASLEPSWWFGRRLEWFFQTEEGQRLGKEIAEIFEMSSDQVKKLRRQLNRRFARLLSTPCPSNSLQ